MNLGSLKSVHLDEADKTPILRQERELALKSLSEGSRFQPANTDIPGPYDLKIGTHDARLVMQMTGADGARIARYCRTPSGADRVAGGLAEHPASRKRGNQCRSIT